MAYDNYEHSFAYIMRGIPGSGKSTSAHRLALTAAFQKVGHYNPIDQIHELLIDGVHYFSVAPQDEGWEYQPIENHIENEFVVATIHSTDNFFLVDTDGSGNLLECGEYRFNPREIGRNHQKNQNAFKKSIEQGIPVVICDNTNTTLWEFKKYLRTARRAGYITSVVTMPHPPIDIAVERNTHGVPREAIEKMLRRWEPWKNGKKK
jgi:predicted kinase